MNQFANNLLVLAGLTNDPHTVLKFSQVGIVLGEDSDIAASLTKAGISAPARTSVLS